MARFHYHEFRNKFINESFNSLTQTKKLSRIKTYISINNFFLMLYKKHVFWGLINLLLLLIIFLIKVFCIFDFNFFIFILLPSFLFGSFLSYEFKFKKQFVKDTAEEIENFEVEILVLEDLKNELISKKNS